MVRFLSLLVSLSVAIGLVWATYLYERSLAVDRTNLAAKTVSADLNRLAGSLEQILNHHLNLTRALAAFVRTNPEITEDQFNAYADELVRGEVGIRSLQLAPDGVVTYVTNIEENARALGHDLLADPNRRDLVLKSIQNKEFVIAGPIDLIQGGKAVIARQPIFLKSTDKNDEFWGFATVLIDPIVLFRESGIADGLPGLRLAIRGKDGLGAQGDTFYGDPKVFSSVAAEVPVHLAVGSWRLAASWTPSKQNELDEPAPFVWGAGLAIAVLAALFLFTLLTRPEQLRKEVQQATEASKLSEERFADFANAASDWLWEMGRDFRVTYVSDRAEEVVGVPAEVQVGRSLSELIGPDYFTEKWSEARKTLKERRALRNFVYTRRHKDGYLQYLSVSGVPIFDSDGEFSGYRGTGADITDQVVAYERAQIAEQHLRTAIESLEDGFVLYDADDRLSLCNERYKEIYAESADLIVEGQTFEEIIRIGAERGQYPEAIGREAEFVAERLRAHKKSNTLIEQELPNGRWLRIAERRTPDGGIVGFRVDITQLKRAQEAAVAASEAKSQFLANMSHEIRTPLNAIIGLSTLTLKTEMNAQQSEYVQTIHSASKTLLGIVNDILDFSKIEAGRMELEEADLDLEKILKDLSFIMVGRASGKPIELIIDAPAMLPANLQGDAMRLGQILSNLATNAIKFTEEGEVVVSLEFSKRNETEMDIRFEIRDTGIGISENLHDGLFEPFAQADVSTTRKYGGTGLGLPIAQQLVELMGGEIGVYSGEEGGSTFWFTAVVGLSKTSVVGDDTSSRAAALKSMGVLLVIPNSALRESVRGMLGPLFGRIACVSNTKDALAALMRGAMETGGTPYDLVIFDCDVEQDGPLNAARKIQSAVTNDDPPNLFLLVRHGHELNLSEVTDLGAVEVIAKPVIPPDLVRKIEAAFSGETRDADEPPLAGRGANDDEHVPPEVQIGGMKVLLVEDNDINRRIATGLLERHGVDVDFAENGRIGVEKALAGDYEAVLMDVQMPVMDGIEAAGEIRKHPDMADLPIIALTAHAMASARDGCFEAGMNDHVAKPIEPGVLFETLARWRTTKNTTAIENVASDAGDLAEMSKGISPSSLNDFTGIDMTGLKVITGGDEQTALSLLRDFCEEYAQESEKIRAAWEAGAVNDAVERAHSLKGVSGNIRAVHVHDVVTKLEGALKQNVADEKVPMLLDDLFKAMSEINEMVAAQA
ncbi:response regulator [Hwanghaeella grinnelliae]|uniref:Sensory/regulatory protein RpfC n=1 Tax=Hwanghaeella grinnelliae TaxID=2500179 RepID=A0A3S2Y3S6_9PROT|nr:response regulator [Hwanghaeella grinnelliae]RVU37759.1 response regulator [Hwanghaeella grinnelliae]